MATGATMGKRKRRKRDENAVEPRKVYDVWYTPTIRDVYAQLKVAEQMLSRINNPALGMVKREMYLLEDMMWQFING